MAWFLPRERVAANPPTVPHFVEEGFGGDQRWRGRRMEGADGIGIEAGLK